jgi:hypothetical protein
MSDNEDTQSICNIDDMSTSTIPRFSISPYFAAYDPEKPTPIATKTVERLLGDAGMLLNRKHDEQ